MRIVQRPSPNWNERKHPIDMLVLHYTGMESAEAAEARLCDPEAGVSAHYVVREDGVIVAMVAEDKRAWHAGVSSWQGDEDLNSRSIGIEIVNGGHDVPQADGTLPPYPHAQIAAVTSLCQAILSRHAIPQARIVGHSDIAPSRKIDPGEHFPWDRLAQAGIGLVPATARASGDSDLLLASIGYDTSNLDAATVAFQRRWRQSRINGNLDSETRDLIARVAAAYSLSGAPTSRTS